MLRKPGVLRVTVIEASADVIKLVAPHYAKLWGERFVCVHADAFAYQPPRGARYGAVWHDIWDDINHDNLPQMRDLHRKYARRTTWQGSWARELLR